MNEAEPHVVLRAPDGILSTHFGLPPYCATRIAAVSMRRRMRMEKDEEEEDAVYPRGETKIKILKAR